MIPGGRQMKSRGKVKLRAGNVHASLPHNGRCGRCGRPGGRWPYRERSAAPRCSHLNQQARRAADGAATACAARCCRQVNAIDLAACLQHRGVAGLVHQLRLPSDGAHRCTQGSPPGVPQDCGSLLAFVERDGGDVAGTLAGCRSETRHIGRRDPISVECRAATIVGSQQAERLDRFRVVGRVAQLVELDRVRLPTRTPAQTPGSRKPPVPEATPGTGVRTREVPVGRSTAARWSH